MVTVPSQKTQRVAVKPSSGGFQTLQSLDTPRQSTSVPEGAFDNGGAGLVAAGKTLSSAGDTLGALALQLQNEENEAEAREADIAFNEAVRNVTYGDPTAGVEGYFSARGKSAIDQYGPAEEAINAAREKVLSSASNDAAREMALKSIEARRQRAIEKMTAHAQGERQSYFNSLGEAREAQAATDAALEWNDDTAINRSLGIIEGEVTDWAIRNGAAPEVAAVRAQQRQSVAVKGAFDAAVANGDTVRANGILAKYGGILDGATKTAMEKEVLEDTQAAQAQALAGSALAKFPGDPGSAREYIRTVASGEAEDEALRDLNQRIAEQRGDYQFAQAVAADQRSEEARTRASEAQSLAEEAIKAHPDDVDAQRSYVRENSKGDTEIQAVREIDKRLAERDRAAELERRARAEVNHQYTLQQRQEKQRLEEARAAASSFLYAEVAQTPRTMKQFRQENPEAFNTLSQLGPSGEINQWESVARNIQEGQLFAPATDGKTLPAIKSMNVAERAELNPELVRPKLTQTEYNQAVASVNSAREELKRLKENPAPYNQGRRAIERFAPKSFGSSNTDKKRSTNERRAVEAATAQLNDWITQQLERGKEPSQPDIEREAARLMLQVQSSPGEFYDPRDWFSSFEGLAAQARDMTPEQRAAAQVEYDDIPAPIRDQIIAVAQRRSITPSEEMMEELAGALAVKDEVRFKDILLRAQEQ